jgi:hypothetical protein
MAITETEKYQYTTIAFAVIAIVLAILLIRAKHQTVAEGVDNAKTAIEACSKGIEDWNKKYPPGTAPTVQSQTELITVLQGCGAKTPVQ